MMWQWHELTNETKIAFEQLQILQMAKLDFNGKSICVTRLEDGFFGIQNTCPHAGAQLHHGHCNKRGVVTCPLHGYKFDMKSGRSVDGNNYKITHYTFKIEDDKLWIGIKQY